MGKQKTVYSKLKYRILSKIGRVNTIKSNSSKMPSFLPNQLDYRVVQRRTMIYELKN